jgi:two-component system, chemotaxis family, sensor kinase CheA
MNFDSKQFMETFIAEAHERLQEMEKILLSLENGHHDANTIDALFRTAHTVKGSAGMLSLEPIVNFTHIVEDVLDRMRDGEVEIDADLIAVLLDSCDHMQHFVDVVAEQGGQLDDLALSRDGGLRKRLQAYRAEASAENEDAQGTRVTLAEEDIPLTASGGGEVNSDNWHISLRFAQSVLKEGLDPLYLIRYLSNIGTVISMTTLADALPEAAEMDPEILYLGFEIDLKSDANKKTIADVFEFAHADSLIHILPPHSKTSEYISLIRSLPESEARVGDILVATGALTQHELDDSLNAQKNSVRPDGSTALLGDILIDQGSVIPEVVQAALDKQKQVKASESKESRYLRVQADKLDELIDLVGELVIAGAGANMLAHRSNNPPLQEATSVISRLVEEIRDSSLKLRMVQIGETFNRFQRVVRDVGLELGKNIDLVITGAESELDKTLIEKIGDPLMHLVRNAIDHGIESAEKRAAAGKPANGTLRLNAYHDSGSIAIEISDDGAGLNRDKILHKAKVQGLIPEGIHLTDQEIYNLIFEAGFSTADTVTNLSGRGVGMDVVRRNITSLRGTVQLDSEPGLGTTVRIRLPLTLAIIDGFRVGVGKSSYVVPLDMVIECVELSEAERKAANERSYLNLRGEVLPYVSLREHFEVKGASGRRENVVVVQYAGHRAGLVVDELMGEFQTVIKPLGKIFSNLRGIGGSTILGSGEVALILDVPSLVQQAVNRETQQISRKQANNPAAIR